MKPSTNFKFAANNSTLDGAGIGTLSAILWLLVLVGGTKKSWCEPGPPVVVKARLTDHFHVEIWTSEDGLPSNKVESLLQTRDGYLWLGTSNGLVRFDGFRFHVYNAANTPVFRASEYCLSLAETDDGTLYVGTIRGLVMYRKGRFAYANHAKETGTPLRVWGLAPRSQGGVWLATKRGIWSFFDGQFLHASPGAKYTVLETPDGAVWAGRNAGLAFEAPHSNQFHLLSGFGPSEKPYPVRTIVRDRDGLVWWRDRRGLLRFDEGGTLRETITIPPDLGGLRALETDGRGRVWFSGLVAWEAGTFTAYAHHTALGGGSFSCMEYDREGNLWIGSSQNGLYRLTPHKLKVYTEQNGLPSKVIWSVSEAPNGDLWVATNKGLGRRRKGGTGFEESYRIPGKSKSPKRWDTTLLSVLASRDGEVWAGNNFGLFQLQEGALNLHIFSEEQVKDLFAVRAIHETPTGEVYVGTHGGLFVIEEGRPTAAWPETFENEFIRGIITDGEGTLWIGTHRGNLFAVPANGSAIERFDEKHGLPESPIGPVQADETGAIWLGSGIGLIRFFQGRANIFTSEQHGLPEDIVLNVLGDNRGFWWLNGHRGIHRIAKEALQDLAAGRIERVTPLSFGEADGMLNAEGNGGWLPNSCRDHKGMLWFPTVDGLVMIDPATVEQNLVPHPVIIERLVANREVVFFDGSVRAPAVRGTVVKAEPLRETTLHFPPGSAEILEFRYTAIGLMNASKVRFKYRLDGYQEDWRHGDTFQKVAYYTNLAPGSYQFRVMASNNHGVWNETGAELSFTIAPHFYETWRFYAVIGLALTGVVVLTVVIRMRHQRNRLQSRHDLAMESQRARIASDLHDELGANLTNIALLSEVVKTQAEDPAAVRRQSERIGAFAGEAVDSMSELVWLTNPQLDTLESLVIYLRETAGGLLESSGIRLAVEFPESIPEYAVTGELRRDLVLIVKETLRNVIRHAEASQVKLRLSFEEDHLNLELQDDGMGFDPSGPARLGNGTGNMRKRIERHQGTLSIHSGNTGTQIQMRVPLGKLQC